MIPAHLISFVATTLTMLGVWAGGHVPSEVSTFLASTPWVVVPGSSDESTTHQQISDPDDESAWFSPCEDAWNDGRVAACEVRKLTLDAADDPLVVDAGPNGGIHVQGWDQDGILVLARVKARARTGDGARELLREVVLENRGTRISSNGPVSGRERLWHVEYRIFVPRKTDLSLETENGPLAVTEVTGTMDLRTHNGPLSLERLGGAVEARAQNGPLSVELSGSHWVGAGLDAATENGPLSVQVPRDYSARFETGTIHGPVDVDYPISWPARGNQRLVTTLGSGGAPVRVVTTNGPFSISVGK